MNKNSISSVLLPLILIIIYSFNICGQVIEKNRVFFRDFRLNPDSMNSKVDKRSIEANYLDDIIDPPFIKNDFMVNTIDGDYGCDQTSVSVAADGSGNYAFTWIDMRNDKKEIYAQFYDNTGNRIGTNFKVNEENLIGNNAPFIAANSNGNFVIAWLKDFGTVMVQRFTRTGQKVGSNTIVSTIYGMNTGEPCVVVDNDGAFMVMWTSEPGTWKYSIYARLIDNNGNPIGTDIAVSEPNKSNSSIGRGKHIAVDKDGNYCLTWSSYGSNSNSNIYLQIINRQGQLIGNNIIVSDSLSIRNNYFPEVTATKDGRYMIVWDSENGIQNRIFDKNNNLIIRTDNLPNLLNTYTPFTISTDRDSTFYILFGWYGNQYIQKITSTGDLAGDTIRVYYSSLKVAYSYLGEMTDIINNTFFIALGGVIRNDMDVYSQKFNSEIIPEGLTEKINDDKFSSQQRDALVKFNNRGQAIILWEDRRNGRHDLYAQVYDQDFNAVNGNIQINETNADYWFLSGKEVQALSDGTFIIAFTGSDEYDCDEVYLQAVDTKGEKVGGNLLVKNKLYYNHYNLAMNVDSNDEILLCWYYTYGAYMKKFDKDLKSISYEKTFMNFTDDFAFNPISVSVDTNFNIFAVWEYYDLKDYTRMNTINGKFFNKDGQSVSAVFKIDSADSYISQIKCKNEGSKNYVLLYNDGYELNILRKYSLEKDYTFTDKLNLFSYYPESFKIVRFDNKKLFILCNNSFDVKGFYLNDNERKTKSYVLHHYNYLNSYYEEYNGINSADIYDNKLIFAYENNMYGGTGSDIWANVRELDDVNFNKEMFFVPVNSDFLYDNYPNPFNSKTKIIYQLLSNYNVKLSVYDILGREVKVLVDEYQEKGIYEVDFDASALASGIYLCRLEAFDTKIKKMILLK